MISTIKWGIFKRHFWGELLRHQQALSFNWIQHNQFDRQWLFLKSRFMQILHVIPSYLPAVRYGGPIFATHGLCKALAARGHEVQVFTTNIDGPKNSRVPIEQPVNMEGVQVRYFPCPLLRRLYFAPRLGCALKSEISKFDVVHLHSVFLWPTWAAAQAARKAGIPYVLSPRGMLVRELIRRRSRLAKSAWIHLVEKSNLQHAAAVHLTSDLETAELERFGWRFPRLAVIPNGIEDPLTPAGDISPDVDAITAAQPLVLFLGRLSWKKGLDRLLRGFAHSRTGQLAIVGTDDEGLAPQVEKLAEDLRIANRVRVLARTVVGSEKEYLFAAAQLFVLTSYSENFGNTVLEAMRRRVPVVVTPEVGAAEIVRQSAGGIVAQGNAELLGAAISHLLNNPNLARSMGEAGQRHAMSHYTWASISACMEELYESLRSRDNVRAAACDAS
jgi:glycosyltransferase involved in cell wall biosynthesis